MKFTRLDNFAPKQDEPHSKTGLGAFLTVLAPLVVAGYCYITYTSLIEQPPIISTETKPSEGEVFFGKFQCKQEQCFVTSTFADNSEKCKLAINATGTPFLNRCTVIRRNEVNTLPICFTSDPIDGLSIIWKRNGTDAGSRAGVILKQEYFDQKSKQWKNSDIDLFFGTHLFSINLITETLSEDAMNSDSKATTGPQITTVHVSSDTIVDNTNMCCLQNKLDSGSTCANNGDPGTVNDHYTITNLGVGEYVAGKYYVARFRTFPTFNSINVTTYNNLDMASSLLNSGGSIWSVIGTGFGVLVAVYRFCSGTSRLKELDDSRGGSIQGSAEMV